MKSSGNTIFLTGGGSGIGRALAHRWHDAGNKVIVAGRRIVTLQETASGRDNIHVEQLDVDDVTELATNIAAVVGRHPDLNVLVNNAGIMRPEHLDRARDLADAEATIATNLLGPIRLTNALVDHLSTRSDAAIINVTSGLAFVPLMQPRRTARPRPRSTATPSRSVKRCAGGSRSSSSRRPACRPT